eukprot:TRINITY_DN5483_c0_g2_i1.p1 TRINITY_DN5483_c0_g2~~TRINITY_DN5483_c0_g2_i1.p1  ORF type:complete len:1929 (+),score=445.39 TRINITY_DN5483_c0_g2_i1:678-5789(+)
MKEAGWIGCVYIATYFCIATFVLLNLFTAAVLETLEMHEDDKLEKQWSQLNQYLATKKTGLDIKSIKSESDTEGTPTSLRGKILQRLMSVFSVKSIASQDSSDLDITEDSLGLTSPQLSRAQSEVQMIDVNDDEPVGTDYTEGAVGLSPPGMPAGRRRMGMVSPLSGVALGLGLPSPDGLITPRSEAGDDDDDIVSPPMRAMSRLSLGSPQTSPRGVRDQGQPMIRLIRTTSTDSGRDARPISPTFGGGGGGSGGTGGQAKKMMKKRKSEIKKKFGDIFSAGGIFGNPTLPLDDDDDNRYDTSSSRSEQSESSSSSDDDMELPAEAVAALLNALQAGPQSPAHGDGSTSNSGSSSGTSSPRSPRQSPRQRGGRRIRFMLGNRGHQSPPPATPPARRPLRTLSASRLLTPSTPPSVASTATPGATPQRTLTKVRSVPSLTTSTEASAARQLMMARLGLGPGLPAVALPDDGTPISSGEVTPIASAEASPLMRHSKSLDIIPRTTLHPGAADSDAGSDSPLLMPHIELTPSSGSVSPGSNTSPPRGDSPVLHTMPIQHTSLLRARISPPASPPTAEQTTPISSGDDFSPMIMGGMRRVQSSESMDAGGADSPPSSPSPRFTPFRERNRRRFTIASPATLHATLSNSSLGGMGLMGTGSHGSLLAGDLGAMSGIDAGKLREIVSIKSSEQSTESIQSLGGEAEQAGFSVSFDRQRSRSLDPDTLRRLLNEQSGIRHTERYLFDHESAVTGHLESDTDTVSYDHTEKTEAEHRFAHRILGVLPFKNPMSRFLRAVVRSRPFYYVMLGFVGLSCIALGAERHNYFDKQQLFYVLFCIDALLTLVFLLEFVITVLAYGLLGPRQSYFKQKENVVEFCILLVTLLTFGSQVRLLNNRTPFLQLFRIGYAVRPLRLLVRIPQLRLVARTLQRSLSSIISIAVLFVAVVFVWGILGTHLFGGTFASCNDNTAVSIADCVGEFIDPDLGYLMPRVWANPPFSFDNVGYSMMTLFEVATLEGWLDVVNAATDAGGVDLQPVRLRQSQAILYFAVFVIIASFIIVQMFIGVLVENFNQLHGTSLLTRAQRHWLDIQRDIRVLQPLRNRPTFKSSFRNRIGGIVVSNWFQQCVYVFIALNAIFLALTFYGQSTDWLRVLGGAHYFFNVLLIVEVLFRIYGVGFSYFARSGWNIFDLVVAVLSVGSIVVLNWTSTASTITRVLRVARLFSAFEKIQSLFITLLSSGSSVLSVMATLSIVLYVYAAVGIPLFGGVLYGDFINQYSNFNGMGNALLMLFRMTTGEDWNSVMYDCSVEFPRCTGNYNTVLNDCGNVWLARIYFYSFVVVGTYIFVNLFAAVLIEAFPTVVSDDASKLPKTFDSFREEWQRLTGESRHLPIYKLRYLIDAIDWNLGFDTVEERFEFHLIHYEARRSKSKVKGTVEFHTLLQLLALKKMGKDYLKLGDRLQREHRLDTIRKACAIEVLRAYILRNIQHRKYIVIRDEARRKRELDQLSDDSDASMFDDGDDVIRLSSPGQLMRELGLNEDINLSGTASSKSLDRDSEQQHDISIRLHRDSATDDIMPLRRRRSRSLPTVGSDERIVVPELRRSRSQTSMNSSQIGSEFLTAHQMYLERDVGTATELLDEDDEMAVLQAHLLPAISSSVSSDWSQSSDLPASEVRDAWNENASAIGSRGNSETDNSDSEEFFFDDSVQVHMPQ